MEEDNWDDIDIAGLRLADVHTNLIPREHLAYTEQYHPSHAHGRGALLLGDDHVVDHMSSNSKALAMANQRLMAAKTRITRHPEFSERTPQNDEHKASSNMVDTGDRLDSKLSSHRCETTSRTPRHRADRSIVTANSSLRSVDVIDPTLKESQFHAKVTMLRAKPSPQKHTFQEEQVQDRFHQILRNVSHNDAAGFRHPSEVTKSPHSSLVPEEDIDFLSGLDIPVVANLKLSRPQRKSSSQPVLESDNDNDDWGEGSLGVRRASRKKSRHSIGSSSMSLSTLSATESDEALEHGLELPGTAAELLSRYLATTEKRAAGDTLRPRPPKAENLLDGLALNDEDFFKLPKLRPHVKSLSRGDHQSSRVLPSKARHELKTSAPMSNSEPSRQSARHPISTELYAPKSEDLTTRIVHPSSEIRRRNQGHSAQNLGNLSGQSRKDNARAQDLHPNRPSALQGRSHAKPIFLPGGKARDSSHHISALSKRTERSDLPKFQSNILSSTPIPRRATASEALRLEATRLTTRRHTRAKTYGDGHELDAFEDLPVDVARIEFQGKSISMSPVNTTSGPRGQKSSKSTSQRLEHSHSSPLIKPALHSRFETKVSKDVSTSSSIERPRRRTKKVCPLGLISGINTTPIAKREKQMFYNPQTFNWEGNDECLENFDAMINSPPRPALISNVTKSPRSVQVSNGMVFDPIQMRWLSISEDSSSEMDPFEGLEDLNDDSGKNVKDFNNLNGTDAHNRQLAQDGFKVGEEFDVGRHFIRRQRNEEIEWQRCTHGWIDETVASRRSARGHLYEIYNLLLEDE